jgi:hypothetical protein
MKKNRVAPIAMEDLAVDEGKEEENDLGLPDDKLQQIIQKAESNFSSSSSPSLFAPFDHEDADDLFAANGTEPHNASTATTGGIMKGKGKRKGKRK